MPPIRIAVATCCFAQPLKPSLHTAAGIGAEAVQLDARNELKPAELSDTGRRQLLHDLNEIGLSVASLSFPTRRAFFDSEQLEARVAAAKTAMQFAYQLEARIVTARIGRIPEDPDSAQFQLLCDVLNDLARHGNHVGATFSITPSRDSARSLAQMIERVTEGPIGINFDPATFVIAGDHPTEALQTLHESVTHVQIRDAIQDLDGSGLEVPVGRGEVPWDEFLALIDEIGYQGWLTIDRTQGDDKRNDAARAVQFLRQVSRG